MFVELTFVILLLSRLSLGEIRLDSLGETENQLQRLELGYTSVAMIKGQFPDVIKVSNKVIDFLADCMPTTEASPRKLRT